MEAFIRYIIISTFCLSVLYIGYLFFQKKETLFNQHRYYLLFAILISVIMPFSTFRIELEKARAPEKYLIEENTQKPEPILNLTKNSNIHQENIKYKNHQNFNISLLLLLSYFSVLSFIVLHMFIHIFKIFMLARTCKCVSMGRSTLLFNDKIKSPFSFFSMIFIPSDYIHDDEKKDIIIHESIHASQYHSIDLILIELLMATMWFNPFVWMMKKSIQSVHEYLADEGVLHTGTDKLRYQALLINQVAEERLICLSSGFNQSLIKKRIMMMTKRKTDQGSKVRILALIPLAVVVFIAVACVNGQQKMEQQTSTNGVALVEPVNMNILYAGIDNPVKISTSGYNVSDLKASVDNGTISGKNGEYVIKPKEQGIANVTISYKGKAIQKTEFRVKCVPDPVAMIAGVKGGHISKKKLLQSNQIKPVMLNFDFNANFEIQQFVLSTVKNGYQIDRMSKSDKITDEQRDLISQINPGQEIYFKNIKCKGPDGILRELPIINLILTE